MRLKSYIAPSMAEAMQLIRQELGEDAIIVSTQRAAGGKGVRITAALEPGDVDDTAFDLIDDADRVPVTDVIKDALNDHNLPQRLVEQLAAAARSSGLDDAQAACAAALESCFVFAPLPDHGAPRPFLLVGPPGNGKSMTVAKLAARSTMKGRRVGVISADNVRAGANSQLAAFTSILKIELISARGPETLQRAIADCQGSYDIIFVDSPGLNPFKQNDLDYLAAMVEAANVEPILVLAAGSDPVEAAEIGEAFGSVGATRLLATRLDTTRRLGSILAAAESAPLMFCDVSASARVVNGVTAITPAIMARMILPVPAGQIEAATASSSSSSSSTLSSSSSRAEAKQR
jgi:flagellar biosynthesis protein FlhF